MNIESLNYVNRLYEKVNTVVSSGGGAKIGNKIIVFQREKYYVINKKQKEVEIKDGFSELIDALIHAIKLSEEECKKKSVKNVFQYIKLQFRILLYGERRFVDLCEIKEALNVKKKQLEFQNVYQSGTHIKREAST